jgi:sec-independent protein translocase protein TatB
VVRLSTLCYERRAMFNIGPGELVVILILALVLLGPEKLPEVARTVGKGMRELRRATEDLKDQVESEFYKLDEGKPPVIKAPVGPRFAAQSGPISPAVALPEARVDSSVAGNLIDVEAPSSRVSDGPSQEPPKSETKTD